MAVGLSKERVEKNFDSAKETSGIYVDLRDEDWKTGPLEEAIDQLFD